MTYNDQDRWLDALHAFEYAQRASGAQASTVSRRAKHVRRFAAWVETSPWHVTADHVLTWLDGLDVADSTRASMRDSAKAFYRWATVAGRIEADPTAQLSYRTLRMTVPDGWERPLTAYRRFMSAKGDAPSSVRMRMEVLSMFARDHASASPFEVSLDDIYEWMAARQWARETRRARKTVLRGFYSWAVATERATTDPTTKLPRIKAGDPVARPATDAEYAAALARGGERWGLALRLSAELGLRRAEVAQVHSGDIVIRDDGQPWLAVRGKGGRTRVLPLPEGLALTMRTLPPGYVLPGQMIDRYARVGERREGHISARYLGKRIGELLPPGVTMHALRHRFATRAYNVNRDVFTVQQLLGHASAATTQRYVQVSDARMRALVEAVGA